MPIRHASIISGGGTTAEKLILATQQKHTDKSLNVQGIDTVLVIATNVANATAGILRAQQHGVPVQILEKDLYGKGKDFNIVAYGDSVLKLMEENRIDLLTLNGCLVPLSREFLAAFRGETFNQHPGNPRQFGGKGMYGRRVPAATLLAQRLVRRPEPFTQIITQRVHPEYDKGAVVKLERIAITPDDTVESLQERTLPKEHALQIRFLQDYAAGRLREIVPEQIMQPGEEQMLELSKRLAKLLYPKG